ncbi:ATP-binding cassette domain-containing protein [Amycolatopsis sp. SID8362]|uniref:ATP-binding cassette domain-containing protein n=1 Tax=Amycolatopsis sp. SID8362 TaxID=2690346 RepID=UPI00136EAE9C|nr:ATP-binding cassette domain-containing protein [Amycolatopsis sp. SID8362]NBH06452.1 ATP-binding cassette domain-containing protein [Amycolatopsis sp. SID8362]NED43150.1 ATP-binding cassette domain-containing protein [Amycolatopsis sp. SID8362]
MITARGLARRFTAQGRTVDAVRGVDLDVADGELVAFLGPNGAGKTTTLRMLTTLLKPTAGTATIAGCDLLTEATRVRRQLGYVAQGGGTVADRKVSEELHLQGRLYGLSKNQVRARAGEITGQLELTGLDNRLTSTLSGGQRRRLDLALGLIHSPKLVFLDEPTTGLDPQSRANLWNHIRALRSEHGVTVFLTTHYLDEADALADRVLVIDHGRIVAEGTPDVLKAKVSGDEVTLAVPPETVTQAAGIVSGLPGAEGTSVTGEVIRFRVPRGDLAVPVLLRALDNAGVLTTSLNVRRPTLDDVFFLLTGRSLRDGEAPRPEPTDEKEADGRGA